MLYFYIGPGGGSSAPWVRMKENAKKKKLRAPVKMAAPAAHPRPRDMSASPLSAEAPPFVPHGADCWRLGSQSDAEKQFCRCASKLRALRADGAQLKEELNMLFDQLLSENYNRGVEPSVSVRPEVTQHSRGACHVPLPLNDNVVDHNESPRWRHSETAVTSHDNTEDVVNEMRR